MLPQKVQKNQVITADLLNNIIDSIRECQIQSGVGYSFSRTAGGTTLSISTNKPQPPAEAQVCPFTPTAVATEGTFNISFSAGTVNQLIPSNMFDNPVISGVTTSARTYFYVKCTTDGKVVTSAVIEEDTTPRTPVENTPDVAPSEFNILIATMSTYGIIESTIPCQNLSAKVYPNIQEDKPDFAAGERNFIQYYNWLT